MIINLAKTEYTIVTIQKISFCLRLMILFFTIKDIFFIRIMDMSIVFLVLRRVIIEEGIIAIIGTINGLMEEKYIYAMA